MHQLVPGTIAGARISFVMRVGANMSPDMKAVEPRMTSAWAGCFESMSGDGGVSTATHMGFGGVAVPVKSWLCL